MPASGPRNDIPERTAVLILSALLLAGSFILHARHSRPFRAVTVERGGVKEQLSVSEVRDILIEARRVDINTASRDELTVIPGIGDTLAGRVIEFRENTAGFSSPEDLLKVRGIGPVKLENMREYIRIGPPASGEGPE